MKELGLPICVVVLVLVVFYAPSEGQRSRKWKMCHCKWAPWQSWTACTRECYGVHMRKRQVWKKNTPLCTGFKVCDQGKGAMQLQRCNRKCTNGKWDVRQHKCVCPAGLYGVCCKQVVTCGKPPAILNAQVPEASFNFSDTASYTCNKGYKLQGGGDLVCGDTGWNGTLPKCIATDPCNGVTCPMGEACKAKGDTYTCFCPKGAACNLDLAPEVVSCPEGKNISTPDRRILYKWDTPKFKDAAGESLVVESNYPSNQFRFPWQKSIVQYTATKKSNGQRAVCEFAVDVKPIPCKDLEAPNKGFLVCSNWRRDYGRFCLYGCTQDYEMPESFDPSHWVVCGSSGVWTPSTLPTECHVMFGGGEEGAKEGILQKVDDCLNGNALESLRSQFLDLMKKSPFRKFCTDYEDMCTTKNVKVKCWNSGLMSGEDDSMF